ncbi:MAG: methyltransferase [Cytophagaceae bacterium]|jgi:tRNA1Val (adenine37-N6)-methyltransferase|nr:methyltransferase [Cytophagaceae bacterium]
MSENRFQFKQFAIHQDKAAMKVGTDGVLLGAWTKTDDANRVLDVGTGTGLIALMIAQRNPQSLIDAIDVESSAYLQAKENIALSAWANRIEVHHITFQQFATTACKKFDLVVTNPPFFVNSHKALNKARSCARHNDMLPVDAILDGCIAVLNTNGTIAIILPFAQYDDFKARATAKGFFEARRLTVTPVPNKLPVRILSQWQLYKPLRSEIQELVIEKYGRHLYSEEYIALTKEFYLKM